MTLEQCKRLKEMGFPQVIGISAYWELSKGRIELWNTRNLHMATEICCNPTAEEALKWVKSKLISRVVLLVNDDVNIIYYQANFEFNKCFDTLSDAVYALIIWAYENKLLEA